MSVNIIGISALYHDAACCLLSDGKLLAAAQEERFSRIKADPSMPRKAMNYCLQEAGLTIADIDCVAYYEDPKEKLARQIWSQLPALSESFVASLGVGRPEREIRELLGFDGEIKYYSHHMSHAASSFYFSGFGSAAILTMDGVGEWATTTYGKGNEKGIELFEEVHYPHSIGLLYSSITSYLGFGVNDGEYKVMGLAPYGTPRYVDQLYKLIHLGANGQYTLDMRYFEYLKGERMFGEALEELLGAPARREDEKMTAFHKDIARSLQFVLEDIMLKKAAYLHQQTGESNICLAGGVALNCVANGRLLREGPFEKMFVQPASNDAGGSLGAAAAAHLELTGERASRAKMAHVYLGPSYDTASIGRTLQSTSLKYHDYAGNEEQLLAATAERLARGKVIGWFNGRMEFGPRSLGARSILADPRRTEMRDRINAMVKKREGFRPFAPAVLAHKASQHFDLPHDSPFMLETCQVISPLDLPAITHVDNSARVQTVHKETNPRFAALLEYFDELTGCPILLNTSFNVKGEPIVCDPEDAIKCFITTDIDCLILQDFIIDRAENELDALIMILRNYDQENTAAKGIRRDVYTFV
ncbi:carbamoyltransferase [Chitinophaga rupis]|uniref:Carbamoyltransferase n=1 Tax=Chitinophaga rupis TaxID=573321 RepID=A0A1H8KF24_9BACT|nr:carbamoyltransferase [Chitinophaga rupis]SEN91387.1 carbamoyltransferase [Chitinophaga rupis]